MASALFLRMASPHTRVAETPIAQAQLRSRLHNYAAAFRDPAISNTTPAAQSTPPIAGDSFSSWWVVMPTEASPILMPWDWLVGNGTTNERIPSTSMTIPIQANGRIDPPLILLGCVYRRSVCPAVMG